ncbi:MAG: DoxX family membrane protein [Cyclobacteriaceae bacterium]|nr:DoxX family membrane protein [Cyclobacteriaceae bacterium]
MKIAVIIVRVLMGILFVFGAVAYFFELFPQPEMTGSFKTFNEGMEASGYMMPMVKALELICGLSFIIGRYVALAAVVIFPIAVNILMVHLLLVPEGLPIALFVFFGTLFLAYYHRQKYTALFQSK